MRVACLTVVYPGVEPFFQEFIHAVEAQSYQAADLVIINDGLPDSSPILSGRERVFNVQGNPAENRLSGLRVCHDLAYDIVVCCDADETMAANRIETVLEYFQEHESAEMVFNNSRYEDGQGRFDLVFKPTITWSDLLDFNVLGYGAMSVRRPIIPKLIAEARTEVLAFDWWLAMSYLLSHASVDFLDQTANNYRKHADNFVGPLTAVRSQDIAHALKVKSNFYQHLADHCEKNQISACGRKISEKLDAVKRTHEFIERIGLGNYTRYVQVELDKLEKVYWWQPAIMVDALNVDQSGN